MNSESVKSVRVLKAWNEALAVMYGPAREKRTERKTVTEQYTNVVGALGSSSSRYE